MSAGGLSSLVAATICCETVRGILCRIEYTASATCTAYVTFATHWTSNLSGMRYRFVDRGDRCRHSCRNRRSTDLKHGEVRRKSQVRCRFLLRRRLAGRE